MPSSSASGCHLSQLLFTLFRSTCLPSSSTSSLASGGPLPKHLIALFVSIWLHSSSASGCPLPQHLFALFLSIWMPSSSASSLASGGLLPQHLGNHGCPFPQRSGCPLLQDLVALFFSTLVALFLHICLPSFSDSVAICLSICLLPSSATDCPFSSSSSGLPPHHLVAFFLIICLSFSSSVCPLLLHLFALFLRIEHVCLPSPDLKLQRREWRVSPAY